MSNKIPSILFKKLYNKASLLLFLKQIANLCKQNLLLSWFWLWCRSWLWLWLSLLLFLTKVR